MINNVKIHVDVDRAKLVIDGEDWSSKVSEMELKVGVGAFPVLLLTCPFKGGDIELHGEYELDAERSDTNAGTAEEKRKTAEA